MNLAAADNVRYILPTVYSPMIETPFDSYEVRVRKGDRQFLIKSYNNIVFIVVEVGLGKSGIAFQTVGKCRLSGLRELMKSV